MLAAAGASVSSGEPRALVAVVALCTLAVLLGARCLCHRCCGRTRRRPFYAGAAVVSDEDLLRLRHRYESRLAQAEKASLLEAAVSY